MFVRVLIFLFFLLLAPCVNAQEYTQSYKEKKLYPMGENIYKKSCDKINPLNYNSMQELRNAIEQKTLCKHLSSKHIEALVYYLWERATKEKKVYPKISVTKEQKCPVCGMFLYKYPKWVSEIHYSNGRIEAFDGMKDLFKYYFEHKKRVSLILTQAYYTQKSIDARYAFYVIGSDVYGPMGSELVPLSSNKRAKKFLIEHRGRKILRFDNITEDLVYSLDE
jgi:nitrous oxide reductase accessory protein NosL